jgi:hypothetical protein
MMACSFQVPKFEWGKAVPLIRRCGFGVEGIDIGLALLLNLWEAKF